MAKARILFDKTELVVQIADKQAMSMNINQSDISTIIIEPCEVKGLLGISQKASEHIVIKTKRNPMMPIMIEKSSVKDDWDSYKRNLKRFAHDNKLTFSESV